MIDRFTDVACHVIYTSCGGGCGNVTNAPDSQSLARVSRLKTRPVVQDTTGKGGTW